MNIGDCGSPVLGSNPGPGPSLSSRAPGAERTARLATFARKIAALVLVLASLTIGILGLGAVSNGAWWGVALIVAAPVGIWTAVRLTPDGATTGYFDDNL